MDERNLFTGELVRLTMEDPQVIAEASCRWAHDNVFEYNPRAFRSYLKAGFQEEGRMRKYLNRDGKRWDMIFMGILREEWEASPPGGRHASLWQESLAEGQET